MHTDEDILWSHWLDVFDQLADPFYEVSHWLLPALLSAACLSRSVATIVAHRSLNRPELRVDAVLRTCWYLALMILAWSGLALDLWAEQLGGDNVYYWENPGEVLSSTPLAQFYPYGHDLWWHVPYLITFVMLSCIPRSIQTGQIRQLLEHGLSLAVGFLILLIVVLSFTHWLVFLYCFLIEMAMLRPHRPPVQEWPTRHLPAAVESVCFVSTLSLVICMAGILVAKKCRLFGAQRTGYMIAVVLTGAAAALMWYVEDQLICLVSPAVGEQVFVHNVSTRIIPFLLVSPGFLMIAWSQTCDHAARKETGWNQYVVVPQSTNQPIATAEMFMFVMLGAAVLVQAASELKTVVTSYGDPFRFFAWSLAALACLRIILRGLPFNIGHPYREPERFYSHLPMGTLLWNTALVSVQCIVVALGLQWLIGMTLLSPVS